MTKIALYLTKLVKKSFLYFNKEKWCLFSFVLWLHLGRCIFFGKIFITPGSFWGSNRHTSNKNNLGEFDATAISMFSSLPDPPLVLSRRPLLHGEGPPDCASNSVVTGKEDAISHEKYNLLSIAPYAILYTHTKLDRWNKDYEYTCHKIVRIFFFLLVFIPYS